MRGGVTTGLGFLVVALASAPAGAQMVRAGICPTRVGITQVRATTPLMCGGSVTFTMTANGNFGGGQSGTVYLTNAVANGQYTRQGACMTCNAQYIFDIGGCTNCGTDAGSDVTPPVAGTVADGVGADVDSQTDATSLSANWSGFSDPETGIASYAWAIGTTVGGTEVRNFTSVGTATSATASSLTLASGTAYYVTVEAMNGAGLTTQVSSDGVTVTSATTRLAFITPARTLTAGTCGGAGSAITVQLQDSSGGPSVALGPLPVTAGSSSASGTWYTDAACTAVAQGGLFTIPLGQSSVSLYYVDPNAGSPSVSLANAGGHINPPPQVQTVVPGPPAQVAITSPPRTVPAGTCSGAANPIAVTLLDAWGNAAAAGSGGASVVATSDSTGTVTWYQDQACSAKAVGGVFTLPPGGSSVLLYFTDTVAGTPTVSVAGSAGIAVPATQTLTVVAVGPSALRWSTEPSTTPAGGVITPAPKLLLVDSAGTLVATATTPVTVRLLDPGSLGGALSGTTTRAASGGYVRFDDLAVDRPGQGYVLEATAPGLPALRSPPFEITGGTGIADAGLGPVKLSTSELPGASCGRPWQATLAATGEVPITWSASDLPDGLGLDAVSGELSWTPLRAQQGTHALRIRATNSGGFDEQVLQLQVACDGPPPLRVGCGCGAGGGAASLGLLALALLRALPRGRARPRR